MRCLAIFDSKRAVCLTSIFSYFLPAVDFEHGTLDVPGE